MVDDYELLSQLPPEALEQLLGLGTLDERGGLLQQQLAQAEALRQPRQQQHSTGGGAIGHGIGNLFRGIHGTIQGGQAQAGMQDLMGQKDAGRSAYVRAISDYLRRKSQPQPEPALIGPSPSLIEPEADPMAGSKAWGIGKVRHG